jgi:signal transduction histidine kinase
MITRGGAIRHIESQGSVIRDAIGKPCKVVVVSRDITERKEAVEVLREALSDLKKSHEDLQATQVRLVQSERLEAVSTFASGVAHEVKNPLQTIILGIDYLTTRIPADNANAAMVLGDMGAAVQRADAIIRGLLEFSIQNKREVKDEDLSAIVEQSLRAVEHELVNYPIRLVKELASNLPPLRLDAKTMKHVFINLLLYSLRSMAEGGRLAVRTRSQTVTASAINDALVPTQFKAGETLVVAEVEESRSAMLEPASLKASNPVAASQQGMKLTGLGIQVLKKIIELSGGVISVTNRKEAGNTYSVMFKAQRESPG